MIGLIVPPAADIVPPEAGWMYPEMTFRAKGLGLGQMSPAGYAGVEDRIVPAAKALAADGARAVSIMGTSLSFYRGRAFDADLSERLTRETGLPATTMAQAILRAMAGCGMTRIAVLTAYRDDVNRLLCAYLEEAGVTVSVLRNLGIRNVADVGPLEPADILPEARAAIADAPGVDGLLISCGGLRMAGVAPVLRCELPVVSSAEAGLWDVMHQVDPARAGSAKATFGAQS